MSSLIQTHEQLPKNMEILSSIRPVSFLSRISVWTQRSRGLKMMWRVVWQRMGKLPWTLKLCLVVRGLGTPKGSLRTLSCRPTEVVPDDRSGLSPIRRGLASCILCFVCIRSETSEETVCAATVVRDKDYVRRRETVNNSVNQIERRVEISFSQHIIIVSC